MTSAPARSAPPNPPDDALPRNQANLNAAHDKSVDNNSSQPSSFATVLHQAKDARADEDAADKDAQDPDKSLKQPAHTAVPVPLAQPAKTPIAGFLNWAAKGDKSEKGKGLPEQEAAAAPSDEQKPATPAAPSATSFLMQAIAGLGIPQFVRSNEAVKTDARTEVRTSAAGSVPIVIDDSNRPSSESSGSDIAVKDGRSRALEFMAPPQAGEGQPAVSSGQLAFAARLSANTAGAQPAEQSPAQAQASHPPGAESTAQSATSPESAAIQPASPVTLAAQAAPEHAGEQNQKTDGQALSTAAASTEPAAGTRAVDSVHALDQPTDVRSADIDPAPVPGSNAAAVRDVRIQVAGSDNQRVDVRVMDRGGELRVSVRADDPSLVRSLQDNVAELSTRLDQAHFRSEVWTPRTQAIAQTDSASTNGRAFSNGEETFGRDGRGQQQNGRQQQQPSWVDDFEENPTRPNSGGTPPWQP